MDVREGAATGALLLDTRSPGGLAEHTALSNEDDVAVGELLLELPGQPGPTRRGQYRRFVCGSINAYCGPLTSAGPCGKP